MSLSHCPIFLLLSLPNTLCLHVFMTHFLIIPLPSGFLCHPPLSHGCVCGHPSPIQRTFLDFCPLYPLCNGQCCWLSSTLKSSPLSHSPLTASLLCCCFSFPVSSLFSKYAYRFHLFLSALWLWTWRGFTMQPIDLLLCDLLQVSCLTIIPLSMAPASFFVLTSLASCMHHACSHSLFWPLWLSFRFLKVLGPFWLRIFVIGVV